MRKTLWYVPVFVLLASCAGTVGRGASVERMYVIDCGENVGQPGVFSNHCYLVRHARGLMLWDSGNPDRLAAMPNGLTNPQGTITAFMRKPLVESLREIGVAPADIQHFAMSHGHGDHSGNANLFHTAAIYMQAPEHDAIFGAQPQKFGFIPANFERLKGAKIFKVNGDHDVFGDGSVLIKSAPGHTPGHQVLVVRLPKAGPVMLSGDTVHLTYSWENRVVPSFNVDVAQSGRSIDAMKEYTQRTGTKLWINHDPQQHHSLPKSPQFVQ